MARQDRLMLAALAAWFALTVFWWAAALWPLPAETPEWVERARTACFGKTESGLPDAGGWLMLVGSPLGLALILFFVWPQEVRGAVRRLSIRRAGQVALATCAIVVVVGVAGVFARVEAARAAVIPELAVPESFDLERIGRLAPALGLESHRGERVETGHFAGAPFLVAFAYGRCETVCPIIVHAALDARGMLDRPELPLVVITLDPWRDTPSRLPSIAAAWRLGPHDHLLGGAPEAVNAALDAWDVGRERDMRTGEIIHPSLVYLVDADGWIVYAMPGAAEWIAEGVGRE